MKDSSSTILFHLLRAALGNEAECALSSDIDWQEVIDLSFDQGWRQLRWMESAKQRKRKLLKRFSQVGRKEVAVGDGKVFLPSADFNGIFLISHSASHFAGNHITLRHLLDWALFVDKQWKEIDWPVVTDRLSRLGLRRFFCCMNAISIDYLGIAAEKFPVLERDAALEQRVLADILHPTFSEKGSGFLFKLRRLKANMWKRNLVATEPFLPRMMRLAWSHVVKPTMTITITDVNNH